MRDNIGKYATAHVIAFQIPRNKRNFKELRSSNICKPIDYNLELPAISNARGTSRKQELPGGKSLSIDPRKTAKTKSEEHRQEGEEPVEGRAMARVPESP